MRKTSETKEFSKTTMLRRITAVLVVFAALLLLISTLLYVESNSRALKRYDLAYEATRFMNASAYLTSEVRAFAATGDMEHYHNYWSEVYIDRNREEGVEALYKLGITEEEQALIEKMSAISNELVPYEAHAMVLAKEGDIDGAMEIVYGTFYNEKIAEIRSLRDELRLALDARTNAEMTGITTTFVILTVITWFLAGSIMAVQMLQKRTLFKIAYVDRLTGMPNYSSFRRRMRNGVDIGISYRGYVVAVDLKNFSIINDVCGVAKGDEIIREMARVLENALSEFFGNEIAAHISGDRFVLFLQSEDEEQLIERIRVMRDGIRAISEKIDVPYLQPVFGIREYDVAMNAEHCYGDASFAKHLLKNSGEKRFYSFFDHEMQNRILQNRRMEDLFEPALRERQFEVWYQPKYSAKDGRLASAEALARWRREDGSVLLPGEFIPLFERNGTVPLLDEFIFESVCAKQREWMDEGREILLVSVNLSRASLLRENIVERYTEIMRRHGVPAGFVELELTETAMGYVSDIREILRRFREAGIPVLVDDFGEGYSSLSILTYGCFDGIKLDKSLVDDIGTPAGARIVEIVTELAHEFRMAVTAEGAESAAQVERLKSLSCELIQGYYYSRPLPEAEFERLWVAC